MLIVKKFGGTSVADKDRIFNVTETDPVQGDVNADGKFDIADIVTLQKWLLAVPGVQLADWKAADLYTDGKVDVFDLCMMRQKLFPAENTANQIHVKNTEELKTALENAKAGDEIILAEGEYVYYDIWIGCRPAAFP